MRAAACPLRSAPTSWDWHRPGFAEGTGAIVADVPVDTPNARAAADFIPAKSRRCSRRAACLRAESLLRRYHPDDPRTFATIRLSYPRIAAVAGPCGLWPEDLGPSIANHGYVENKPYYNFGCATQRNLAAMIDNPSDLEQPRSETCRLYGAAHGCVREVSQGRADHDHLSRRRQGQTQRYRQMISYARQNPEEQPDVTPPHADDYIAPAPRGVGAGVLRDRAQPQPPCDRRAKTAASARPISRFKWAAWQPPSRPITRVPTPNVIILETEGRSDILAGLDELAQPCATPEPASS